ncbi:MAG: hypothetical protein AMXMBFR59_04650 [Rhodanobacteraceae bacterium]
MQQLSYGYDPLGNMTWREDRSGVGFLRETLGYDNLQRLTSTIGQRANGVQEVLKRRLGCGLESSPEGLHQCQPQPYPATQPVTFGHNPGVQPPVSSCPTSVM